MQHCKTCTIVHRNCKSVKFELYDVAFNAKVSPVARITAVQATSVYIITFFFFQTLSTRLGTDLLKNAAIALDDSVY